MIIPKIKFKFIPVLQSFTKEELKEFGKFLCSPYYNSNKKLAAFYNVLKKYHPAFSSKNMARETLFRKLYPGKKYDSRTMEKLSSEMYLMSEKYLAVKGNESDRFIEKYSLLRELNERRLFGLFKSKLKSAEAEIEKAGEFNFDYYINRFRAEYEISKYNNYSRPQTFSPDINIQKMEENLINFFLLNILQIYSYMMNLKKRVYDYSLETGFWEYIRDYIQSGNYKKVPFVEVYFNCMMLTVNNDDRSFEKFREIVYKYFNRFDNYEKQNMCTVMINYCRDQIEAGNDEFISKQFEIYKKLLNAMPFGDDYLHHNTFRNIFNCALMLREYRWAGNFIKEYSIHLKDEHRESSFNLCKASLEFYRKNFETALIHLTKVQMVDLPYKCAVKEISSQVYYETESLEPLLSACDAYRHLLVKNKSVGTSVKELGLSFVKNMTRLAKVKHKYNGFEIQELKNDVLKCKNNNHKKWFLEKIAELNNRFAKNTK